MVSTFNSSYFYHGSVGGISQQGTLLDLIWRARECNLLGTGVWQSAGGCGQASRELYFLGSSDTGKDAETLAKLKATFAKT